LKRSPTNLDDAASAGLWGRLSERKDSTSASAASPNLWQVVEDRLDVAKMWPRRIDDFEPAEVGGSAAGKQYMLKNRRNGAYLGLTEADVFLWNLMDGTNSVKSMVIEFFVERKRYAPDHVVQRIALLKANGFLEARYTPVFESLTQRMLGRLWTGRLVALFRFLTSASPVIPNPDRHFSTVYDRLGWLCYTPAGLAITLVLFLADVILFPYFVFGHEYQLLTVNGRYQWGFLVTFVVMAVSILIH
jgi:putative peptide zinc metalloprotease protein